MGKAKRSKLSRRARHDPVGLPPSPAGATSAADGGGAAGADGGRAGKAHVLLQEVRSRVNQSKRGFEWC